MLRIPVAQDAQVFFDGYASRPEATRYMTFVRHRTCAETDAFVEQCVKRWDSGQAAPWTIVERASGRTIGAIDLRESGDSADFGYVLCERDWGQGFATEAACAVMQHAWSRAGTKRLWASCHPDNIASIKVLAKAGLTFETRREGFQVRPQLGPEAGPSLIFSQTRES